LFVERVFSAVDDESVSFGSAVNCLEGAVLRKFKIEIEVKVGFFAARSVGTRHVPCEKLEVKECLYFGTEVESKKKNELGQVLQFVGFLEKLCWREGGVEGEGRRESKCPQKRRGV
jgi:hypothetical protein